MDWKMARDVTFSKSERFLQPLVQHYHPVKYWKMREKVVSYKEGDPDKLLCQWYLYRIKRMDAFHNASMGTHLGYGATFAEVPHLPHGLNGIIISHNAKIGKNCTIFHQVTIGEGNGGAPTIGDNCLIGAGAKIIGGITVGNNVKIGANCIVSKDIPDNATVVLEQPRILIQSQEKE